MNRRRDRTAPTTARLVPLYAACAGNPWDAPLQDISAMVLAQRMKGGVGRPAQRIILRSATESFRALGDASCGLRRRTCLRAPSAELPGRRW